MNPLTDKVTNVKLPDGRTVEIRQPGAIRPQSTNWRLTRDAFERYEHILRQMVANLPNETSFDRPPGMSINTFCARLRDARQALLLYGYDPKLQALHAPLEHTHVIAMDPSGERVWFRERGQVGRREKADSTVQSVKRALAFTHEVTDMPSASELDAMCLLLKSGRVNGPFIFRGRMEPSIHEHLEIAFDVGISYDDKTDLTTLL